MTLSVLGRKETVRKLATCRPKRERRVSFEQMDELIGAGNYIADTENESMSVFSRAEEITETSVTVQKWLDGSLHFLHNNKELLVEEIRQRPKKQEERALSA